MPKKIVLIEDDPFLVKFYKARFAQQGFYVSYTEDGAKAVALVKKVKPALVLTDIMVPHKDGFQIIKELKQDEETKDIPVFALTKLSQEKDKKEILALGANEFITKLDVQLEEVVKKAEDYLSSKK